MRQHIDTAPVWEAYRSDCECPLCQLEGISEASYVDNFLGGSVMEPAVRMEVNQKGFCGQHFKMLYDAGNRLGLALMADTYMKETLQRLKKNAAQLAESVAGGGRSPVARLMKRGETSAPQQEAAQMASGCILCGRLETAMARYEETLLYMWKHESEFRRAFSESKGLCLKHYADLARLAPDNLSGKELRDFIQALAEVHLAGLARVEKELEWFTLKFDYRNQDKPWGNSRDAVERALGKLRGRCVERAEEKP